MFKLFIIETFSQAKIFVCRFIELKLQKELNDSKITLAELRGNNYKVILLYKYNILAILKASSITVLFIVYLSAGIRREFLNLITMLPSYTLMKTSSCT